MPPNILFIVLDSARAHNFQFYGGINNTAPHIDEFGQRATVYTQARAPSTWSLPSHVSMFTGLEVPEHNVVSRNDSLGAGNTIWGTLGEDYGYDTGVFSENPFVTADSYGLAPAFDQVVTGLSHREYPFPDATDPNAYTGQTGNEDIGGYLRFALSNSQPVRSILNAVVRKLETTSPMLVPETIGTTIGNKSAPYADAFLDWQADRDRWAAFLNLTDVHYPYQPTVQHDLWGGEEIQKIHDALADPRWDFYSGREPWWKRTALESLYEGCLHQVDATIQRIISTLEDRGQLTDTLVVISSDHGEGFGEPSRLQPGFRVVGHAGGIHERLLHVPLIVKYPGQEEGKTVRRLASLTAFPSVVSSLVVDNHDQDEFTSDETVAMCDLDGLYESPPKNFDTYREELHEEAFSGCARAVYRDQSDGTVRKLVQWDEQTAVVDIFDAHNVVTRPADDVADDITTVFDAYEDSHVRESKQSETDEATRRRLEDLGYL